MRRFPMTLIALLAMIAAGSVHAPELNAAQEPVPPPDPQEHHEEHHAEHQADSIVAQVALAEEESLTVRTEEGRSMTFRVDEDTRVIDPTGRITETDKKERLAALKTGDQVVVRFRPGQTPGERVATEIELRDAEDVAVARPGEREPRPEQQARPQQQPQQQQAQQQRPQQQPQQQYPQQQVQQQEQVRQQQEQVRQQQLPATSSTLPLVALLGLLGMVAASGVVVWAHRED